MRKLILTIGLILCWASILKAEEVRVWEWNCNSVIVESSYNTAVFAITKTDLGTALNNILSSAAIDVGLYRLQINPGDLQSAEGGNLSISWLNAAMEEIAQTTLRVPVLVAQSELLSEHDAAVCANNELVILNGAIATADKDVPPMSFKSIHIYGGGQLVVPQGAILNAESISMYAGTWQDGAYVYAYPQLSVDGVLNCASSQLTYSYLLTSSHYYPLALPYDAEVAKITNSNNSTLTLGKSMFIQYYDGAARATGGNGWKMYKGSVLEKGKGYVVSVAPTTIISSGNIPSQRVYSKLNFVMQADYSAAAMHADQTIPVYSYPSQTGRDNDAGWNLVGNPYLSNYNSALSGLTNNGIGLLVSDGADGYVWQGTARYVVVPNELGTAYKSVLASSVNLQAYKNFFVQIGSGDALKFTGSALQQTLVAQRNPLDEELLLTLNLFQPGTKNQDQCGILIDDNYTDQYEINADLAKWVNNGLNLYSLSADSSMLSYIAINTKGAQNIRLGYIAPQAGDYAIQLENKETLQDNWCVILTDHQTDLCIDLLKEDYVFTAQEGDDNNRFTISVTSVLDNITHLKENNSVELTPTMFIYNGVLYIKQGNNLFNLEGKRIKE